jgi:hypothetical protein
VIREVKRSVEAEELSCGGQTALTDPAEKIERTLPVPPQRKLSALSKMVKDASIKTLFVWGGQFSVERAVPSDYALRPIAAVILTFSEPVIHRLSLSHAAADTQSGDH